MASTILNYKRRYPLVPLCVPPCEICLSVIICLKFAKNSLRLSNFKKLFPEHANNHNMKKRNQEKYSVSKCNGKRYAVSSIPSMKKMLNKDYEKQKIALKSILSPTNFACTDLLLR